MLTMVHYQLMARPSAPPSDALGLLFRRRLNELGKSQNALAKHIDRSQGWVSQYLFGETEETLKRLAKDAPGRLLSLLRFLEWTPEQFVKDAAKIGVDLQDLEDLFSASQWIEHHSSLPSNVFPVNQYRIPVVDAGAGPPMWNENAEYITLHIPDLKGKPESELFAVRVGGDSMQTTLKDGDVVVFWTGGAIEPGRIVAVHVHWDGVVVKRLQRYNGSWYLYSDNPNHPPVPLNEDDRILGVAATLVRKM